jgi:hypothetical protein
MPKIYFVAKPHHFGAVPAPALGKEKACCFGSDFYPFGLL